MSSCGLRKLATSETNEAKIVRKVNAGKQNGKQAATAAKAHGRQGAAKSTRGQVRSAASQSSKPRAKAARGQ